LWCRDATITTRMYVDNLPYDTPLQQCQKKRTTSVSSPELLLFILTAASVRFASRGLPTSRFGFAYTHVQDALHEKEAIQIRVGTHALQHKLDHAPDGTACSTRGGCLGRAQRHQQQARQILTSRPWEGRQFDSRQISLWKPRGTAVQHCSHAHKNIPRSVSTIVRIFRARGKRRGFSPGATARHSQSTRVQTVPKKKTVVTENNPSHTKIK